MTGVPKAPRIPRAARGPRKVFSPAGEEHNQLLAAVSALTGELAVLRQRVRTLESMVVAAGTLAPGAVDGHELSATEREDQAQWNEQLLERVFYRYLEKTR